ncbi:MAG: hypothetical protein QW251_04040 [Desulfurococcaceae archaeon]
MSRIEELLPITSAKFRADFPELYWDAFVCASLLYKPEERRKREGYIKTALLKEYSRYLRDTLAERGLISSDASIQSILEDYRFYVEEEVKKILRAYSTKRAWTCLGVFYLDTIDRRIHVMNKLLKEVLEIKDPLDIRYYILTKIMEADVIDDEGRGYIGKEEVPTIPVGEELVPRTYLLKVHRNRYDFAIVVKAIIPKLVKADSEKVKGEYYPILDAVYVPTDAFINNAFIDEDCFDILSEDEKEFVGCFIYRTLAIHLRAFKTDYFSLIASGATERDRSKGDIILAEFISRYLPEEDRRKILSRYTIENLGSISL